MKKLLQIIIIFTIFLGSTNLLLLAKTQAEIDAEILELQTQTNEQLAVIAENKLDEKQTEEKIMDTQKSIAETEEKIKVSNDNIANANENIADLEITISETNDSIKTLSSEADQVAIDSQESLRGLQKLEHKNIVIDIVFGSGSEFSNVLTQLRAVNVFTDYLVKDLDSLKKILVKINEEKVKLEAQMTELETEKANLLTESQNLLVQQETLNNQLLISQEYKNQLIVKTRNAENLVNTNEDKMAVAQASRDFLEEAGCGPNDVYGVDCAVPPPPEPSPPSNGNSGGEEGGGNSGGEEGGGNSGGGIVEVSDFRSPIKSGRVTDEFGGQGALGAPFHTGIDLGKSCGAPIYASAPGVVIYSGWTSTGGGNIVSVLHLMGGKNYVSTYNHMSSVNVSVGQNVGYGTQVGVMGTTGSSTGCHLHFELNTGSLYGWDTGGNTFFDPRNMIWWPGTWVEFSF